VQEPAAEEEAARPPDEPDAEEAPDDSGAAPDTDEEPQQSAPQEDEDVSAPDEESSAEDDGADAAQDSTEEELRQLDEREAEIEERQQELDEDEEELQVLTERVEELYEETAEDQATLSDRPAPADLVAFVLGDGSGRFELALVEFGAASVAGEQTIPVANRELTQFQGEIVVAHQSTERLIMLDPSSLSIIAESDVTVVPGSRIRAVDGHLLTVIPQDDLFVVGEFDAQLVLQRRSARPVLEYTDIVVREDELLVQGEDGELRVLQLDEVSP
jgi:flagellar motor protein MotB